MIFVCGSNDNSYCNIQSLAPVLATIIFSKMVAPFPSTKKLHRIFVTSQPGMIDMDAMMKKFRDRGSGELRIFIDG